MYVQLQQYYFALLVNPLGIYAYTSIMDRIKFAWIIELAFGSLGLYILYNEGNWFGLDAYTSFGNYIIAIYFISTIIGALYISFAEKQFNNSTVLKI